MSEASDRDSEERGSGPCVGPIDALVWLSHRLRESGATSEAESDRDGFLSHAAESHALGLGIAAGFLWTAAEETKLLGLVYGAAVYGKATERDGSRMDVLEDVIAQPHYALAGVVLGASLGLLAQLVYPGSIPIPPL